MGVNSMSPFDPFYNLLCKSLFDLFFLCFEPNYSIKQVISVIS